MNHNVNIWYEEYLVCDPCEKVIWPSKDCDPQFENHCSRVFFLIVYILIMQWKQLVIANIVHISSSSIISYL